MFVQPGELAPHRPFPLSPFLTCDANLDFEEDGAPKIARPSCPSRVPIGYPKLVGLSSFTPLDFPLNVVGPSGDLRDDAGVEDLSPSESDGDHRPEFNVLNSGGEVPELDATGGAPVMPFTSQPGILAATLLVDPNNPALPLLGEGMGRDLIVLFIGYKLFRWLVG